MTVILAFMRQRPTRAASETASDRAGCFGECPTSLSVEDSIQNRFQSRV